MAAFDYKKEFPDCYRPGKKPGLIEVPPMVYVAVDGVGDPNEEGGAYQQAIGVLYALSYTVKMSKMGSDIPEGYFDYVVPPLEGLWWAQDGRPGVDYANKAGFAWTAMIRLPEFVTVEVFEWAREQAAKKKGLRMSKAYRFEYLEGLCAQVMHLGPYDDEPPTIEGLLEFIREKGYRPDLEGPRRHHEIYLSDPRKCAPDKLKTIIRYPVA